MTIRRKSSATIRRKSSASHIVKRQKVPKKKGAEDRWPKGRVQPLVATRHPRKRRARLATWRLYDARPEADRGLVEALSRAQFAAQGRRLSFRSLDADILYQSRREDTAQDPAATAGASQDRAETPVWARIALANREAPQTDTATKSLQAARMLAMKRSSCSRNRVLSAESVRAESNTSSDADPVSAAPRLTSVILAAASLVPSATV